MGGSEVHLLLEIKNTKLDPIWIKTLPSGVAVYQSVFKDIWGSDLKFLLALTDHSPPVINQVMLITLSLVFILLSVRLKVRSSLGLTNNWMIITAVLESSLTMIR